MTLTQFFRNLIVGKDRYIAEHGIFKSTILRGHFSVLLFWSGIIYGIIDTVNGIYYNLPIFLTLALAALVSFISNRNGKYILSNIILLVAANLAVYLFASRYHEQEGLYIFFIITGLSAVSLFGYRQRYWGFAFVLLSYGLFLLGRLTDFSLLEKTSFAGTVSQNNFILNFSLAFSVSVVLLFFLIDLNHHAEQSLQENGADLVRTTEELKKSRLRFEMAIKGSGAGIYEWDLKTKTIFVSPFYKELLGYTGKELTFTDFEDYLRMVHPDDRDAVNATKQNHFENRIPYHVEVRLRTADGEFKWFSDSGMSLLDEKGNATMVVGSIIDISERKNAEQKIMLQNALLAKTNAELDRFVYSTSHDLRAPLSSLLGLITVAEKTEDVGEIEECLRMMKDRIRTMENFIKEIIEYSRNTRLDVKRESVKIFPLIQDVVENLRFSEGAENIFVRYNIPPDLDISTDENRLRVVINNLIGNSIKYSDSTKGNPFISIDASKNGSTIHICVEDNGIGIAPEHHAKIFDMFYRASEKSHGSGLGLYIVKETIEKLRGKVEVNSIPGKGTTFSIQLPIEIS